MASLRGSSTLKDDENQIHGEVFTIGAQISPSLLLQLEDVLRRFVIGVLFLKIMLEIQRRFCSDQRRR